MYQPTHPIPYLESIDASNPMGNTFSVIINARNVVRKYRLCIYDTSNVKVYDTGVVELQSPVYGSYNKDSAIEVIVPPNSGMVNGKDYNWQITLYEGSDISISDNVTSQLYYFRARTKPSVIFEVPSVINTCEYKFEASYTQEQGERFLCYSFRLYSNGELIDYSKEKMDSDISYVYISFIAENKYKIELNITMEDHCEYIYDRTFTVNYNIANTFVYPNITINTNNNSVNVDYSQTIYSKGLLDEAPIYKDFMNETTGVSYRGLSLSTGKTLSYNTANENTSLNIPEEFSCVVNIHFDPFFVGDILCLTNDVTGDRFKVWYDGSKFYYKIGVGYIHFIDPYTNILGEHQEESAVKDSTFNIEDISDDTLYIVYPNDTIYDDSNIVYNDITSKFWWNLTLLPDTVKIIRGQRYIEI